MNVIQIIAINDCSTDASIDILNKYNNQHPEIVISEHIDNKGAEAARNNAITKARGKCITFIDNDNWLGDRHLKTLYKEAEETSSKIVFSNMMPIITWSGG